MNEGSLPKFLSNFTILLANYIESHLCNCAMHASVALFYGLVISSLHMVMNFSLFGGIIICQAKHGDSTRLLLYFSSVKSLLVCHSCAQCAESCDVRD